VTVVDNTERNRYELRDGDTLVGFSEYHFHQGEMALLHTEIRPEFTGRGRASELIRAMLDDARARGLPILPYCPFVRTWLTRHPDYADVVPATHQDMLEQQT
jgi:hypothetical protein